MPEGRGDRAEANRVTNRSFALGLIVGLSFAACIVPLARFVAAFVLTDPAAVDITVRYLRFDSIGLIFSSISYMGAAARAAAAATCGLPC